MSAASRAQGGFTLVETVVAFAILAAGLVALMAASAGGVASEFRVERAERSLSLARSTLARVGADIPLQTGAAAFSTGEGDEVALEIVEVAPAGAAQPALFQVSVRVRPRSGGLFDLATLRSGAGG